MCGTAEHREHTEKIRMGNSPGTKSFQFDRELGRGGFGVVHIGIPRSGEGNRVAIKTVQIPTNPELKQQLHREISLMQNCQHQNILRLYGLENGDNCIHLILELCDESLSTLITKEAKPNNVKRDIIRQIR